MKDKNKDVMQRCKGCLSLHLLSEFWGDSGMCAPFKRAWDAVYRMAQRQGQKDWLIRYCEGPANRKKILLTYLKSRGEAGLGRNLVEMKFNFAMVKEEIVNEMRVKRSAHGKMMHKDEYLEFARTLAGGGLNIVEALAQWSCWEADPAFVLRDELGPSRSPLRLWIKLGDFVDFDDIQSMLKRLECQASSQDQY